VPILCRPHRQNRQRAGRHRCDTNSDKRAPVPANLRHKRSGRTEYLQIVKNERVDGKPRQSVVATLGRVEELAQDGTLDRLLRSGARFARSAVVLTAYERGET
jgi:hypothetical protein